jgi:tRNA modification GTPase
METVAAISTPNAPGGIAMIRISGDRAIEIADRTVQRADGKPVTALGGYRCAYGYVSENGTRLDDVIVTVFRAPHSFTGEDTAEITCHGGLYVTRQILRIVLQNGAVPAGPGEFTKRAFFNGKISLTQAEAVMDVIEAEGAQSLRQANLAREGRLGTEMKQISDALVAIMSALAYWLDDAEEFPPELETYALTAKIEALQSRLQALEKSYDSGRMLRAGIRTALLGLPNAGKSSVMNWLCGEQRSIVTEIPGTTRDIVREQVKIDEFTLVLSDTAGIRQSGDVIEEIGVGQAMHEAENADLVLYVIDAAVGVTAQDRELLGSLTGQPVLVLWNKTDLTDAQPPALPHKCLQIAAKSEPSFDVVAVALRELFGTASRTDTPCIMNERQAALIRRASQSLTDALGLLQSDSPLDLLLFTLESAANALREIDGEQVSENVINGVFTRFCVGK